MWNCPNKPVSPSQLCRSAVDELECAQAALLDEDQPRAVQEALQLLMAPPFNLAPMYADRIGAALYADELDPFSRYEALEQAIRLIRSQLRRYL